MSTRIRYKETKEPGVVRSVREFTNEKGTTYYVKLNLQEKTYEILYRENNQPVKKGGEKINNLNVLKRNVKKDLSKLGVKFDADIRDRSFGICEKGYNQEIHTKTDKTTSNKRSLLEKVGL